MRLAHLISFRTILLIFVLAAVFPGRAAPVVKPVVKQIGPGLYAYISDNDSSANSTFLIGGNGILVVDTGLNDEEGGKLLHAIRNISALPVQYIVNTHYHPDHQGGNATVGPAAVVICTDWTRERTVQLLASLPSANRS